MPADQRRERFLVLAGDEMLQQYLVRIRRCCGRRGQSAEVLGQLYGSCRHGGLVNGERNSLLSIAHERTQPHASFSAGGINPPACRNEKINAPAPPEAV